MRNLKIATMSAAIAIAAVICPTRSHALFGFGKPKQDAPAQPPAANQAPSGAAQSQPQAAPQQSSLPGMTGSDAPAAPNQMPGVSGSGQPADNGAAGSGSPAPTTTLPGTSGSSLPSEVVIKGSESGSVKIHATKPPLNIETDVYESIRQSLAPDESLLLAESPFTVSWRATYPEFLYNKRVLAPWFTTFSERPGIIFRVQDQLSEALQHPVDSKEARGYQWSLTIADEQGRVFQHYEASKDPPAELVWNGQNDQGEWIKAGRSYSAVYMFTDPGGSPHTKVGKPIQFTGIVHQEADGLHLSLDASVLFGASRDARTVQPAGLDLLRAASDLVKRRYNGIPVSVQVSASTQDMADAQAGAIQAYLLKELMLLPQHVTTQTSHAQFSDQRTEIVLLNR